MHRTKPLNGRMLATYWAGVLKTENYVNNGGYEEYADGNWQDRCRSRPIKELPGAPKYRCKHHTSPGEYNHSRVEQRNSRSGIYLQFHASRLTAPLCREHRRFACASQNQRLVMQRTAHDGYSGDTETQHAPRRREKSQRRSKAMTIHQCLPMQRCKGAVPTLPQLRPATCGEYQGRARATAQHR